MSLCVNFNAKKCLFTLFHSFFTGHKFSFSVTFYSFLVEAKVSKAKACLKIFSDCEYKLQPTTHCDIKTVVRNLLELQHRYPKLPHNPLRGLENHWKSFYNNIKLMLIMIKLDPDKFQFRLTAHEHLPHKKLVMSSCQPFLQVQL